MSIANLPIGENVPEIINIVIEIPAGSKNKYEYDEELDVIMLDRVMYSAMAYPYDYGFVPETRCEDGDHLDVLLILDHSLFPGCVVAGRPIGMMKMIDDGEADEKLICVPAKDPRYDHITELDQLSAHLPKEIQHFFEHYKDLQNKTAQINGWCNAASAKEFIKQSQAVYASKK